MSGFQPALERLVGDVLLDRADGDRAEAVIERAGALAEPILRADAATDLRQGVGLVGQLGGLEQIAFLHQPQPVGDVVVDRALPFAERIAAGHAAAGLLGGGSGIEVSVDLGELARRASRRAVSPDPRAEFEELQVFVRHLR